jgi:hypothetical protein
LPRCPVYGWECARATSCDEESGTAPLLSNPPAPLILILGGSVELLTLLGFLPSPIDPFGDQLFAVPGGLTVFWDEPLLV